MRQLKFLVALVVVATMTTQLSAQQQQLTAQPLKYTAAYKKAQKGDKPLLVLVTAKWCPPCQVMKSTTIPELMKKKAFKDFHYSTVDLDQEQTLARQLIGTRGVPQLIMYEKKDGKWLRRYLRGAQTAQTVEAFVAQSEAVRTASAKSNLNK